MLCKPCEVILNFDTPSKSVASPSVPEDCCELMPSIRLPPAAIQILQKLPPDITALCAWGTVKPPPPIYRLETISKDICEVMSTISMDETTSPSDVNTYICSKEIYNELTVIWKSLCIAKREKRLSVDDLKTIRNICNKVHNIANKRFHVCIFPITLGISQSSYMLASISKCIFLTEVTSNSSSLHKHKSDSNPATVSDGAHLSIISCYLAKVGYIFNMNPYFSIGPIQTIKDDVKSESRNLWDEKFYTYLHEIVDFQTFIGKDMCIQYCIDYCNAKAASYVMGRSSHPTLDEKKAYSGALWVVLSSIFKDIKCINPWEPSENNCKAAQLKLKQFIPNLSVFCRHGPATGIDGFSASWYSVWNVRDNSMTSVNPLPVLQDDDNIRSKGSGVHISNLLKSDHNIQFIGIFDFCDGSKRSADDGTCGGTNNGSDDDCILYSRIDDVILNVLDIPRMSNKLHFSLQVKTSGKAQEQQELSERMHIVLSLLRYQILSISKNHFETDNKHIGVWKRHRHGAFDDEPVVYKHNSLELVLKYPTARDTSGKWTTVSSTIPAYALRGALLPTTNGQSTRKVQSILIAGEVDDYLSELEDIITLQLLRIPQWMLHSNGNKNISGLIRKSVILLKHIENEDNFIKYLERYFGEYFKTAFDSDIDSCSRSKTNEIEHTRKRKLESSETEEAPSIRLDNQLNSGLTSDAVHGDCSNNHHYDDDIAKDYIDKRHTLLSKIKSLRMKFEHAKELLEKESHEKSMKKQKVDLQVNDTKYGEKGNIDSKDHGAQHRAPGINSSALTDNFLKTLELEILNQTHLESSTCAKIQEVEQIAITGNKGLSGRGRGVTNLPAWVTQNLNTESSSLNEATTILGQIPINSVENSRVVQDLTISEIGPLVAPGESAASRAMGGRGRGRGVSNVPAWLSSGGVSFGAADNVDVLKSPDLLSDKTSRVAARDFSFEDEDEMEVDDMKNSKIFQASISSSGATLEGGEAHFAKKMRVSELCVVDGNQRTGGSVSTLSAVISAAYSPLNLNEKHANLYLQRLLEMIAYCSHCDPPDSIFDCLQVVISHLTEEINRCMDVNTRKGNLLEQKFNQNKILTASILSLTQCVMQSLQNKDSKSPMHPYVKERLSDIVAYIHSKKKFE